MQVITYPVQVSSTPVTISTFDGQAATSPPLVTNHNPESNRTLDHPLLREILGAKTPSSLQKALLPLLLAWHLMPRFLRGKNAPFAPSIGRIPHPTCRIRRHVEVLTPNLPTKKGIGGRATLETSVARRVERFLLILVASVIEKVYAKGYLLGKRRLVIGHSVPR